MDIGANVDCRPQHLYQFAVMASSCTRLLQQQIRPRVGLLSNGEEVGKGNALVKETYELLQKSSLNFVGNVEGRDVYRGDVDVVVCDGFVGNISLKISEGLAEAAMQMLKTGNHENMARQARLLADSSGVFRVQKNRLIMPNTEVRHSLVSMEPA